MIGGTPRKPPSAATFGPYHLERHVGDPRPTTEVLDTNGTSAIRTLRRSLTRRVRPHRHPNIGNRLGPFTLTLAAV